MKVLITGARGFVARHLTRKLARDGYDVYLTTHSGIKSNKVNTVFPMDVKDVMSVHYVLSAVRPDAIIHLAAQSNIYDAWQKPTETMEINSIGTLHLIQSILEEDLRCKLIIVGSGEEYGAAAKTQRLLTEESPCYPQNPYAVSKFAASQLSVQLSQKNDLNVVYLRPFNHFGPGQRKGFVISDFCSQVALIEQGLIKPIIKVGDLSTYRDFLPIDDIVAAYERAVSENIPAGIYNISSGNPISINYLLHKILAFSAMTIHIARDEKRFRPAEVKSFAGDGSKFQKAAGWLPRYDIDGCLLTTLNWWRSKASRRPADLSAISSKTSGSRQS